MVETNLKCSWCGKSIVYSRYRKPRKYCSKHCSNKYWHTYYKQYNKEMNLEWRRKNPKRWGAIVAKTKFQSRIKALAILGGKCVKCGITDWRVLQINHLTKQYVKQDRKQRSTFFSDIVSGKRSVKDLEIRCANCNILYEYEQGRYWRNLPKEYIDYQIKTNLLS